MNDTHTKAELWLCDELQQLLFRKRNSTSIKPLQWLRAFNFLLFNYNNKVCSMTDTPLCRANRYFNKLPNKCTHSTVLIKLKLLA